MAEGYFWGADPDVNSKLRERIALQIMQSPRPYPKTVGEGLTALGEGIGNFMSSRKLFDADVAAQQRARGIADSVIGPPTAPASPPQQQSAPPQQAPPQQVPPQQSIMQAPPQQQSIMQAPPRADMSMLSPQPLAQTSPLSQPPGIMQAPPQQQRIAQAPQQAAPGPGYVPQPMAMPTQPQPTPMSDAETRARRALVEANLRGDEYTKAALTPLIERETKLREANDARQVEVWKEGLQAKRAADAAREQGLMTQAQREQDYQIKSQQVPQGAAPAQAMPGDSRLGTDQSPQRTGMPAMKPVPQGVSPQKWAELQAPELIKTQQVTQASMPKFNDMLKSIAQARSHPGREYGLGFGSTIASSIPGTSAKAFSLINEQLAGKNFLTAYEAMRGTGSISEKEGQKAEQAQARLSTAQSPADYDAALNDLEIATREAMEMAQRKANMPVTAWRRAGDVESFAPDVGERRVGDGGVVREYIGGNPALRESWKTVK